MTPAVLVLTAPAQPGSLAPLRLVVAMAARRAGLPEESVWELKEAVSEVATGLIEGGAERVEVEIELTASSIHLRMPTPVAWRDSGPIDRLELLESLLPEGAVSEAGMRLSIRLAS